MKRFKGQYRAQLIINIDGDRINRTIAHRFKVLCSHTDDIVCRGKMRLPTVIPVMYRIILFSVFTEHCPRSFRFLVLGFLSPLFYTFTCTIFKHCGEIVIGIIFVTVSNTGQIYTHIILLLSELL